MLRYRSDIKGVSALVDNKKVVSLTIGSDVADTVDKPLVKYLQVENKLWYKVLEDMTVSAEYLYDRQLQDDGTYKFEPHSDCKRKRVTIGAKT